MHKDNRIYIAGHTGLVGHNLLDELKSRDYKNLIYHPHSEVDLIDTQQVNELFVQEKPEYVFLAAARVGGIQGNNLYGADFIYENTMIQSNVIKACHDFKVKKLMFLGSCCIYPKEAPVPVKEGYLLTGPLEETNKGYAIAKINGLIMCQLFRKQYYDNFICAMPTNLFGKYDTYDLKTCHAFPALLRKVHEAKINNKSSIEIWGTGKPLREFLFAEDLASALVFLMQNYDDGQIINVGPGKDIPILDLIKLMCKIIGYTGEIKHNLTKPDGTFRRVMDVSKINQLGWCAETSLEEGIRKTYQYYLEELK